MYKTLHQTYSALRSSLPGLLGCGLAALLVAGASPSWAQVESVSPIPEGNERHHRNDIEDEDMDDDLLQADTPAGRRRLQEEVEQLSPNELRAKRRYGVLLGVGTSMPWQSYTIAAGALTRPNVFWGMYAGGGNFTDTAISIESLSYDIKTIAVSAGALGRYFFTKFNHLSVEGDLGYGTWHGSVDPHGGDTATIDPEHRLSDSYHASGLTAGLSCAVTWLWTSGFFLDWTLAGAQYAKVLQSSHTRSDSAVAQAVAHDIEGVKIYGLIDLRVGWFF